MKKVLAFVLLAFSCVMARSEVLTQNQKFSDYEGISVSDVFNVTLTYGEDKSYSAEMQFDKVLFEYVNMKVSNKVLRVELDRKAFSKEVKAQVRKMNSLKLNLKLFVPASANITSVELSNGAVLNLLGDVSFPSRVEFKLYDSSALKAKKIAASALMISTINKAAVDASIESDDISVQSSGNSSLDLRLFGKYAHIDCNHQVQSKIVVDEMKTLEIVADGMSSKMTVSGDVENLSVAGKQRANIDAKKLSAKKSSVNIKGCTLYLNTESVDVDLKPDATLYLCNNPQVNIIKIEKASVIRFVEQEH